MRLAAKASGRWKSLSLKKSTPCTTLMPELMLVITIVAVAVSAFTRCSVLKWPTEKAPKDKMSMVTMESFWYQSLKDCCRSSISQLLMSPEMLKATMASSVVSSAMGASLLLSSKYRCVSR